MPDSGRFPPDPDGETSGAAPSPSPSRSAQRRQRGVRRRRRALWSVAGLVVAGSAAVTALALLSGAPSLDRVSPAPGGFVTTPAVGISCELPGYSTGDPAPVLLVDGRPVDAADLVLQEGLVATSTLLADGPHTVAVHYKSSGLFARSGRLEWEFIVDTVAPTIALRSPSPPDRIGQRTVGLAAETNEESQITLAVDGAGVPLSEGRVPGRSVEGDLALTPGAHTLVLTAVDRAGNRTVKTWTAWADFTAPRLVVDGRPAGSGTWGINKVELALIVEDDQPGQIATTASLDGVEVDLVEETGREPGNRRYLLKTGVLCEGRHDFSVRVRDAGGHEALWEGRCVVDSTGVFGTKTMRIGAVGADVAALQRLLIDKGLLQGSADGVYGPVTAAAVLAYNRERGLPGGESVSKETLVRMVGSIRVDLSERKLYLYSDGEVVKTYRVAVGMPRYPTPTGRFKIVNKVVDPTWTPPDSDWARGMEPVGPGEGNPIGTRWMGLDSPGIGIHGTYESGSIGRAASHGCIRMYLQEAEDLFERVYVGTPVEIVE